MEIIIGMILLVSGVLAAPGVIADAIATARMASAGEFDRIDRQRDRRAARNERWASAWATRRAARRQAAGGTAEDYKPGLNAYLADMRAGWWAERIRRAQVRREQRPEWTYDPDRPGVFERAAARARQVAKVVLPAATARPEPKTQPEPAAADPLANVEPGTIRFTDSGREQWNGTDWVPAPAPGEGQPEAALPRISPPVRETHCTACGIPLAYDSSGHVSNHPDNQCVISNLTPGATQADNTNPTPAVPEGSTMSTPTDINNNADARAGFAQLEAAGHRAAEALDALEQARADIATHAPHLADAMSGNAFDREASNAAQTVADGISTRTLADWSEIIDTTIASAQAGIRHLDKYVEAEVLVNDNKIDGKTLETASSS